MNFIKFNHIAADMVKDRQNGMRVQDICKKYKVSYTTYSNYTEKYNRLQYPFVDAEAEGTYSVAPIETEAESAEPKPEIVEKKKARRPAKEKPTLVGCIAEEVAPIPGFGEVTNELSINEQKYEIGELKVKVFRLKRVIKNLSAALKDFSSLQLDDAMDDMYRGQN